MMRSATRCLIGILALSVCSAGCRSGESGASPELQQLLAAPPESAARALWPEVQRFYAARQNALTWTDARGRSLRVEEALDALRGAESHGLNPADYGEPTLRAMTADISQLEKTSPARARGVAKLDVGLTTALLKLGRHVATGRLDPKTSGWKTARTTPDLVSALTEHVAHPAGYLAAVGPRHPEYAALQDALRGLKGQTSWSDVPATRVRPGQRDKAVAPLRERLAASGYLRTATPADPLLFDADVVTAVRAFQEHHALKPTGQLDRSTVAALNVPLADRIAQVALNMERWRWLPDDLGERHFLVNVPYFHLIARERGTPVLDIRVIVGKPGNETPLFSDEMTHVVFSPYWNIPDTIASEETVPAIARDPSYLERNNLEVVNRAGRVMPASEVPWENPDALAALSFRQRPGARNALGFVKFMFPNRHNVYIHDTPTDSLFLNVGRAYSHGCVRVEEPEALAQYVLRDQPEWTPEAIAAAMRAGHERHVKLRQPIPVHLVYFTAWVDPAGGLHFQEDVYRYDATQRRAALH